MVTASESTVSKPANTDTATQGAKVAMDYLRQILTAPVYDVAVESDLTRLHKLESKYGHAIYLKREDQQPVHSFKLRGAYNKMAHLPADQAKHGVIAASAGNHAQGLALAAQRLGIHATIVMPITTPEIKVNNVRHFGGEVRLVGKSFNEAQSAALEFAKAEQKTFIHPFDDPLVIAGQGTVAKEVLQQLPQTGTVFVPVGGGGLLAGMAVYIKLIRPDVKVFGVEAEDSACLAAALKAKQPIDLDNVGLFADGVAVKRIGEETFKLCQQYCDEVITVSTDEICAAIKDIFEQTRVIAEPAGALSLAGLCKYCQTQTQTQDAQQSKESNALVAILSGANMNFHSLRYVSERCELGEQKEAVMAVTIPEEKGSFRRFCQHIGGRAITEFNYRFSGDENSANIFVGVKLAGDISDREQLLQELNDAGYHSQDFTDNELAKLHVRYMVGGQTPKPVNERLFQFEFPEYPGALAKFLDTLGERYNITLFHYRNHGAAFGQVLAGFEIDESEQLEFFRSLKDLGYDWHEETHNPAYNAFLNER